MAFKGGIFLICNQQLTQLPSYKIALFSLICCFPIFKNINNKEKCFKVNENTDNLIFNGTI